MIQTWDLAYFRWFAQVLQTPLVTYSKWVKLGIILTVSMMASGCQRPSPSVQLVPKDVPFTPQSSTAKWTYRVPPNWVNKPSGSFRLASFDIPVGAERVDCSVSTLSGAGGGMLENINRWRGQLGLSPLATLPSLLVISISGESYQVIRMSAATQNASQIQGMVVLSRLVGDHTWFFKLTGPVRSLPQAETELRQFIQGVSFQ